MSANGERPGREVAHRIFAAEYDDASLSHAESDRERAPNYVITPTGARINRLFVVGTVTEISSVNEDMIRARVVDPTGAFVVYAGQYQPDELAALESIEPPAFVAITGKARTFQPEDSDRVYTSIRPESVATVDVDTRDRWVVDAAERTIDRIETYAAAAGLDAAGEALTEALIAAGVDDGLAAGIPLAQSHYGTTPSYLDALRTLSVEAVEVVAGERDQVGSFDPRPDETGTEGVTFADLAGDVDLSAPEVEAPEGETPASTESSDVEEPASPTEAATDETDAVDTVAASGTTETGDATDTGGTTETGETAETGGTVETTATPETAETSTTETPVDETSADDVEIEGSADESAESTEATAEYDEASIDEPAADDAEADESVTGGGEEPISVGESTAEDDLGDFDAGDGMYEMDDEEREQIESEFGAEFSTGAEVDDPGEADIDVPDEPLEDDADDGPDADAETELEGGDEPTEPEPTGPESDEDEAAADGEEFAEDVDEPTADADESTDDGDESDEDEPEAEAEAPAEDVDVQALVVETMTELDEGDGADRAAVVESVVEETGLSEAEVEDAIQDALMGGQCYEPDDETLKAI